jgi:hypothetical protein
MDLEQAEGQRTFLEERIVPRVRAADGFVSGHWSKPNADGVAYSFIVFQDETAAASFAASVRSDPHNRGQMGVDGEELSIVEISVTA